MPERESATDDGRAVVATAYGGPEVLTVVPFAAAEPQRGEVTISLRAAGVNPIDVKLYGGSLGRDAALLPMRLGGEGAGVVSRAGAGAAGPDGVLRPGDEVIACTELPGGTVSGFHATEITVPAANVVRKPRALGWAAAGGLLLTGVSAVHALAAVGARRGERVLVHGVAGGVGRAIAALAALEGIDVVGTAAAHRHAELRALGVRPVGYGPGLTQRVRAVGPVDAAIDAVGTEEAIDTSLELLGDRARIATLAGYDYGAAVGVQVLGGAPGATDAGVELRRAARTRLTALAAEGRLMVPVVRTFALRDAALAHAVVAGGHAGGKVVLLP